MVAPSSKVLHDVTQLAAHVTSGTPPSSMAGPTAGDGGGGAVTGSLVTIAAVEVTVTEDRVTAAADAAFVTIVAVGSDVMAAVTEDSSDVPSSPFSTVTVSDML